MNAGFINWNVLALNMADELNEGHLIRDEN